MTTRNKPGEAKIIEPVEDQTPADILKSPEAFKPSAVARASDETSDKSELTE